MTVAEHLRDLAVSDSGFVFDPFSGATFSLNPTGLFVLARLKEGLDRQAIVEALRAAFEVGAADDPARDLDEFVLLLKEHGLVPAGAEP